MAKYIEITILITILLISITLQQRIAVIGGGTGGAGISHFLFGLNKANLTIDIYEKNNHTGGRAFSVDVSNHSYDFGASFFLKENELIYNLTQEYNVTLLNENDPEDNSDIDNSIAFVDGKDIVFELADTYKIINIFKMLWRYGLAPLKINRNVKTLVNKFREIYSFLNNKTPFSNLQQLIEALDLQDLISITLKQYLENMNLNQLFIDEFINGYVANIYNQDNKINGFEGMVNLAGILFDAYHMKGGNSILVHKIIDRLLQEQSNKFNLYLNTNIDEIIKLENGKYQLIANNTDLLTEDNNIYDIVVIAYPLAFSKIKFSNITIDKKNYSPSSPQVTYSTLIKGKINSSFFSNNKNDNSFFSSNNFASMYLIINKNNTYGISSFAKVTADTYKIESDRSIIEGLNNGSINLFEPGFEIQYEKYWDFAYPQLKPYNITDLPSFIIDENMYCINAMETAASCMELSLISAMNIKNIIEHKLQTTTAKNIEL